MSNIDSLSLAGKTAIVTGSGKENGIGAAIALALARNGARVAINYVSEATAPRAATVAASIEAVAGKGSVVVIQQDIATPEGTKKLVAEAIKAFGVDRIDILGKHWTWDTFVAYSKHFTNFLSFCSKQCRLGCKRACLDRIARNHPKNFRSMRFGPIVSHSGHSASYVTRRKDHQCRERGFKARHRGRVWSRKGSHGCSDF